MERGRMGASGEQERANVHGFADSELGEMP